MEERNVTGRNISRFHSYTKPVTNIQVAFILCRVYQQASTLTMLFRTKYNSPQSFIYIRETVLPVVPPVCYERLLWDEMFEKHSRCSCLQLHFTLLVLR